VKTLVGLESRWIESGFLMKRFVEGEDRRQGVLLPEFLDDYVAEDNPVRAIDVFVDKLDLRGWAFLVLCRRRRAVRPTIPPRF
jgi:transposase